MCLTKNDLLTFKAIDRAKPIFAYKVVKRLRPSGIKTSVFCSPFNYLEWNRHGFYKAVGFQSWMLNELHGGAIHVWRTLKAARKFRDTRTPRPNYFILKVKIYPEDLIAVGKNEDLAARQVYLTRDELRKVRRQSRKTPYVLY